MLAKKIAEKALARYGNTEGNNAGFMVISENDLATLIAAELESVWKALDDLINVTERCIDEPGMPLPVPMVENNLKLIAGACNACMKIDPEDPQRVADWLVSVVGLLRIGYEHNVGTIDQKKKNE